MKCTACRNEFPHTPEFFLTYVNAKGFEICRGICKKCESTQKMQKSQLKVYEDRTCEICEEKFTPKAIKGINKRRTCYKRECAQKLKSLAKKKKETGPAHFAPYANYNPNDLNCNPFG